jgi:hypothetical protein
VRRRGYACRRPIAALLLVLWRRRRGIATTLSVDIPLGTADVATAVGLTHNCREKEEERPNCLAEGAVGSSDTDCTAAVAVADTAHIAEAVEAGAAGGAPALDIGSKTY